LRLITLSSYELRNNLNKKALLENAGKRSILILYKDKVMLRGYAEKKTSEIYLSTNWELRTQIKSLLKWIFNLDLSLDFLNKSWVKDDYFKEYEEQGFIFKTYKNGNIEIRADLKETINIINNLIRQYHRDSTNSLIIEH
jgi:hypothetical protein